MSKSIEQIRAELDSNIPRDVISQREAGFGGKKLSYLEGWYVIDRLNKVIGQGNWNYQLAELTKTFEGEVNGKFYVSYIAKVELSVAFPGQSMQHYNNTIFTDVGFGDGQDKSNPGKAHELAVKEAVTDGIKRCAKSLGMSMGLALYDKTQEFVGEETAAVATTPQNFTDSGSVVGTPPKSAGAKEVIKSAFRVLKAQNKISKETFVTLYLSTYKVDKVENLSDSEAIEVVSKLKSNYQELGIQ